MGSYENFLKSIRQGAAVPAVRSPAIFAPRIDFETFETPPIDATATALMIVKAAKTRDRGGPKVVMSDTARAILAAGKRRRGEA